jgi:hypothetical protein
MMKPIGGGKNMKTTEDGKKNENPLPPPLDTSHSNECVVLFSGLHGAWFLIFLYIGILKF